MQLLCGVEGLETGLSVPGDLGEDVLGDALSVAGLRAVEDVQQRHDQPGRCDALPRRQVADERLTEEERWSSDDFSEGG